MISNINIKFTFEGKDYEYDLRIKGFFRVLYEAYAPDSYDSVHDEELNKKLTSLLRDYFSHQFNLSDIQWLNPILKSYH